MRSLRNVSNSPINTARSFARRIPFVVLLLGSLLMIAACSTSEDTAPEVPEASPAPEAVDLAQAEAGNCASQPYEQRPAAARDSYSSPTNFLRCDSGEYALCYYSGADPLPCDLSTDETGDCQCQVFTASAEAPMYIEIGGILNACVYAETVEQCGANGAGCQNICTDHPSIPGCSATSTSRVAPACDYVADGTFNPAADVISTFSLATVSVPDGRGTFSIASNDANGQYAGCMTAPCTGSEIDADGNEYTTCACPLWPTDGSSADYQFGRRCHPGDDPKSPRNCDLADDQVWSAAVDASLTSAISAE